MGCGMWGVGCGGCNIHRIPLYHAINFLVSPPLYPVTCFGYQWNKMLKKRWNVCQVDHQGPLPNLALKTRLEGAMGGMLVEVE